VNVTAKASDPNDVQVLSQPFSLTNGQQYTVSYQAKADATRTAPFTIRINAPDWHSVGYSEPAMQLGTDWQTYTHSFTASNVGSGNNVLAFSVGDQTGTIWIANVKVTTDQAVVPAAPVQAGKSSAADFVGAVVWSNPPASAAGSLDNVAIGNAAPVPALKINITAKSDNLNDVQVFSQPFALTEGQKYVLTYDAKSEAARTGIVSVRANSGDYHSVGYTDPSVAIGTDWQHYSEAFTATNASGGNNVVAFCLGTVAGGVWIANLKLTTDGPVNQTELPGGAGVALADRPKNAYRILFVGNSITQHGVAAPLNWDHVSGMAASSMNTDYVHLLVSKIQPLMPGRPIATRIASLIPGGLGTPDYRISPVVEESAGFNPDLVIIQHGEHEQAPGGADAIAATYNKLLDLFTTAPSHPKIVCVGVWSSELNADGTAYAGWTAVVEQTMQTICAKRVIPYISVVKIAADPANHGYGTDPGVQWHPNDAGHAKYADAIFAVVRPLISSAAMTQKGAGATSQVSG
jgi:hypothetical protein